MVTGQNPKTWKPQKCLFFVLKPYREFSVFASVHFFVVFESWVTITVKNWSKFPRFPSFRFWVQNKLQNFHLQTFIFFKSHGSILFFVSAPFFGVFKCRLTTAIKIRDVMFIIFWEFLIVEQIFFSPQVKLSVVISNNLVWKSCYAIC